MSTGSCGHRGGGRPGGFVRLRRGLIEVASAAVFENRIPGGEHSTHVIRQRQKRAHRNVRMTTRCCRLTVGCRCKDRGGPGDCALPAVRQPDDDQPWPSPRASVADRKAIAIQGMMRVNDPDLSDSTVKRCGISECSVTPLWPTPSSIVWSIRRTGSNSRAEPDASRSPANDTRPSGNGRD